MICIFRLIVLGAALAVANGCVTRTGDLTVVATKNVPSLNATERGSFEGKDCKVFGIPNLEEAIDRAIEKGDGNAMTDVVLYFDNFPFSKCYRAKGTVVEIQP